MLLGSLISWATWVSLHTSQGERMNKISNFFIACELFIVISILFVFGTGLIFDHNLKFNKIALNSNNVLKSKVKAIGVLDENNYGVITFYIYLIPKNKVFTNSTVMIDIDDVSLGNTFQDYLKNTLICLNNITHNKLKKYTVIIKGESKFKDVDGGSGSIMLALGILSALYNKTVNDDIIATGTVNPDCSIGPILGIREKLVGVENLGYKRFYVPYQNYKSIKGLNTTVKVIPVKNLREVLDGEFK